MANDNSQAPLNQEEIINIIDDFLNGFGYWSQFKTYVEEQGYKVSELGFEDEDENVFSKSPGLEP